MGTLIYSYLYYPNTGRHFICNYLIQYTYLPCVNSTLLIRKQRLREVKWLFQGHIIRSRVHTRSTFLFKAHYYQLKEEQAAITQLFFEVLFVSHLKNYPRGTQLPRYWLLKTVASEALLRVKHHLCKVLGATASQFCSYRGAVIWYWWEVSKFFQGMSLTSFSLV